MTGKEEKMNRRAETDRKRMYGLNAVMNLWNGEMKDQSRYVKYHQMVDGIKYYFKEFGFYLMGNKKRLNMLE